MTLEELNEMLCERVDAEHEQYRAWLLTLTPEEILKHSYDYAMREDIVCALDYLELSEKQYKALLKSKTPLADIFKDFSDRETDHMDNIRDTIECHANAIIRSDFIRRQREASR